MVTTTNSQNEWQRYHWYLRDLKLMYSVSSTSILYENIWSFGHAIQFSRNKLCHLPRVFGKKKKSKSFFKNCYYAAWLLTAIILVFGCKFLKTCASHSPLHSLKHKDTGGLYSHFLSPKANLHFPCLMSPIFTPEFPNTTRTNWMASKCRCSLKWNKNINLRNTDWMSLSEETLTIW